MFQVGDEVRLKDPVNRPAGFGDAIMEVVHVDAIWISVRWTWPNGGTTGGVFRPETLQLVSRDRVDLTKPKVEKSDGKCICPWDLVSRSGCKCGGK